MNTERLAGLLGEATALPWAYRPCEYDDWGWIRGPERDSDIGRYRPIVANARNSDVSESEFAKHRADKTDPYGPNAMLIVEAVNAFPTLLSRLAALEEALKPFAEQPTVTEVMAPDWKSPWMDESVDERIHIMGERKRENDANILRARATLAQAVAGEKP